VNDDIYQVIFNIAEALEGPVVVLALLALALVVAETGAFVVEVVRRRGRRVSVLSTVAQQARQQIDEGDRTAAAATLAPLAWSAAMREVLDHLAAHAGEPGSEPGIAKRLADFDFGRTRRLGRTRLLVRAGPALGLMGTLIPLSPALEGLAEGDVTALTENLRLAFSITVLGLLIGVLAFGLSLARDRIYGQDYSDLEYVAALLTAPATDTATDTATDPATDTASDTVPKVTA
jgi:biopolymer transport protein ExbB/TolQ